MSLQYRLVEAGLFFLFSVLIQQTKQLMAGCSALPTAGCTGGLDCAGRADVRGCSALQVSVTQRDGDTELGQPLIPTWPGVLAPCVWLDVLRS